jgi:uncharacterized membrane protein
MDKQFELPVNVGVNERLYSVLAGSLLMTNAFRKKFSLMQAVAGGFLIARGLAGYCPAYAVAGKRQVRDNVRNVNIKTSMVVGRPRNEVYAFWRDLTNLPLFMKHLEKVEVVDQKTSRWKANVPGGFGNLQWDAEITKEKENEFLGWNSLPDSSIENAGKVVFEDAGNNSTRIKVVNSYHAPMGLAGEKLARLFNPLFEQMVKDDISNFKHHIEKSRLNTSAENTPVTT